MMAEDLSVESFTRLYEETLRQCRVHTIEPVAQPVMAVPLDNLLLTKTADGTLFASALSGDTFQWDRERQMFVSAV